MPYMPNYPPKSLPKLIFQEKQPVMAGPRCLCDPVSSRGHEFVEWIGYFLSQCVYTSRDKVGFAFGLINIGLWMGIHIPQLYLSHKTRGKGLAFGMLVLWCLADVAAVMGLVLTRQKGVLSLTQYYFLTMDTLLLLQYLWFHHLSPAREKKEKDSVALTDLGSLNSTSHKSVDNFSTNDSRNPNSQGYSNNSTLRSGHAVLALSMCVIALAFSPVGDAAASSLISLQQQVNSYYDPFDSFSTSQDASPTTFISLVSNAAAALLGEDKIPSCTGSGDLTKWKRNFGIVLAWTSSIITSLSKVPQILYQNRRKSTYGLSMIFLSLSSITPFTYSGSLLIPTRTLDNTKRFTTSAFYLETFPYVLVAFFMMISNAIIWYQVYSYRGKTEQDRLEDLQQQDSVDNSVDYQQLKDYQ